MPFDRKQKNILEDLFSSVLQQFKYHLTGNLKLNYFGIFQSLKLYLNEKNPFKLSLAKLHSKYFRRLWVDKRFFKQYKIRLWKLETYLSKRA